MSLNKSELLRISKAASFLISENGIKNPPVNVETIAKNLDLDTIPYDLGEGVSGALFIKKDKGFIGYNPTNHRKRQRFTIAHEIGHFILHRTQDQEKIFVDKDFIVKYRSENKYTPLEYRQEQEANAFAAELLMPSFMIESALKDPKYHLSEPDLIDALSKLFDVSVPAMTIRLLNINF